MAIKTVYEDEKTWVKLQDAYIKIKRIDIQSGVIFVSYEVYSDESARIANKEPIQVKSISIQTINTDSIYQAVYQSIKLYYPMSIDKL